MRRLETPSPVFYGAGKRTTHVAKKLTFQKPLRQGPAINADKRTTSARAELVDRLGDQLLARPCLAKIKTEASELATRRVKR